MAYWQNTQRWPTPEPFIRFGFPLRLWQDTATATGAVIPQSLAYRGAVFPSSAAPMESGQLTMAGPSALAYTLVIIHSSAAPQESGQVSASLPTGLTYTLAVIHSSAAPSDSGQLATSAPTALLYH